MPVTARRIRALILAIGAGALPAIATAGSDAPPAVRYALAAWSTEQSGDVLAITQDLDGYLWLGTPDGPVRFDGARFQRWSQIAGTGLPARPAGRAGRLVAGRRLGRRQRRGRCGANQPRQRRPL
jgi:hypothetical protein